jgi:ribosome recycling factor
MIHESLKPVFEILNEDMEKAIEHAKVEFQKLRAGKATPTMLESVMVEYYGSNVPLNQVANVTTPDARTLLVQPWEKSLIRDIERSIINSNLGYNPQNDGNNIIINIPPLTEERRLQLVKQVKGEGEHAKISIRNVRKDAMEEIKREKKDGLSEDLAKDAEGIVQEITDKFSKLVDELVVIKEKEIMTI